jgi:hypothetical protein
MRLLSILLLCCVALLVAQAVHTHTTPPLMLLCFSLAGAWRLWRSE